MEQELAEIREALKSIYKTKLERLKKILLATLKRSILGEKISLDDTREYSFTLMYYQILKNPKDQSIVMLMPIVNRFISRRETHPDQIELTFLIYRLLNYDYNRSKFLDDDDSPTTQFGGLYT